MSTIRVVNLQHTDATEPNIVLESDGTAVFASGITISGGTNLTISGIAEFASGTVSAPTITFIDDNNTGIYEPAADTVAITTAATERLRVDSSGQVGIGTTSPVADLDIAPADSTATLRVQARTNTSPVSAIELMRGTNTTFGADIYADYRIKNDNAQLVFEYAASSTTTERMRLDSNGRLGIGSTSPEDPLHIKSNSGAIRLENTVVSNNDSTIAYDNTDLAFHVDPNNVRGSSNITFSGDGNERVRIDSIGNVGIGTSSPTSYANSQVTLVIEDDTNPAICWSDTGQTRDWWAVANGSNLSFNYADGGGSGSASNVTQVFSMTNGGIAKMLGTSESLRLEPSSGTSYIGFWDGTSTAHYGFVGAGNKIITGGSSSDLAVRSQANLVFSAGGATERMRILSSGGLTFNGDTAAANALDDYEEGTFTPTISSGFTSPSYAGGTAGIYTKIGNIVRFHLRLDLSGGTANANQIIIDGLPFTCENTATQYVTCTYYLNAGGGTTGNSLKPLVSPATNDVQLWLQNNTGVTQVAGTDIGNTIDILLQGVYQTA